MKKVLITGGSGTIGLSFIKRYYNDYEFYNISRNEKNIKSLIELFPNVTSYLANIEDYTELSTIINLTKPDIIIHSAALKHIDLAEKNPLKAIKTNIIGSYNIVKAAIEADIPLTVGISTDKACKPESVYGYTKKLMEEMFQNAHTEKNRFVCTRFANVAGSSGSVIPRWKEAILKGENLKITDLEMNRLMFTKQEAAELLGKAIELSDNNKKESFILSKKMKSVNLYELAKIMSDKEVEIIGKRPGEKLNEDLIALSEISYAKIIEDDYIILKKLSQFDNNDLKLEYSSLTAEKALIEDIKKLIEQE